ncbi:general L-amino acid transport system permease protein [Loktanella ponticola]|uniref:General L-amino acid transport system permease protein n=1 Tax=Yoonia ponticola TaxID=1524255 RepID=A0A7W9BNC4_9RHOB|nr:amino acid ABC transporter permease [Yoonia ponticola]MBB5723687.1 general L-amino acid transport system permease protein [Yoonia ponticola]
MTQITSEADTKTFEPLAARGAPTRQIGPLNWLRKNLFSGWLNSLTSLVLIGVLLWVLPVMINWLFLDAVFRGNGEVCRQSAGACWPFIYEKIPVLMVGVYPQELIWRPAVAGVALLALVYLTFSDRIRGFVLISAWLALPLFALVMIGGAFGMTEVNQSLWGGLMLSILLALVGVIVSIPLGVMLALGRFYGSPLVKALCIGFIELIRGVPLITILFMVSVMMPLFLPPEMIINNLMRIQIGMIFFSAAYMAEVIRGGLQAIPKGQTEASLALGVSPNRTILFVIVPQALRHVLPPLIGRCIALFKDTSLVIIVGLLDFLGMIKGAALDPDWLGFQTEAYFFAAFVYWLICYSLSRYGRALENRGPNGAKR